MTTKHKGTDIFDGNAKFIGKEIPKARRIQNAGHTHYFFLVKSGYAVHHLDHHIQRIGDYNDEGIGRIFFNLLPRRFNDTGINTD